MVRPEQTRPTPTPVAVVIPLLDDADGIGPCLESVLAQHEVSTEIVEVVIADGGSSDGSLAVVERYRSRDPRISVIENPERFVPSGLNRCIQSTTAEVIVRVDSHTVLEGDYVERAVDALITTGADVVGGGMRPIGTTSLGEAVAWALSSPWGVGGSRFHFEGAEGWTDAVYMGVFPRATFDRFGGYNPRFLRNQDDELTYRIREQGGRVWLSSEIRSTYTPRHSLRALFRQFRGYGRYKPLVLLAHPGGARMRHLIPLAAALGWLLLPVAAFRRVLAVPPLLHITAVAMASRSGERGTWPTRTAALLGMHTAYGIGFLEGLLALVRGERPGSPPDVSAEDASAPSH